VSQVSSVETSKGITVLRREFLTLGGAVALFSAYSQPAAAQGAQPKLTQILRADLQGQAEKVQETVVSLLEMPAGASVLDAIQRLPRLRLCVFTRALLTASVLRATYSCTFLASAPFNAARAPAPMPNNSLNNPSAFVATVFWPICGSVNRFSTLILYAFGDTIT
jgi:hypothetical protein